MVRLMTWTCVALLTLTLTGRAEDKAKPAVVPFELLKTGHMTVMVKVDGKGPYKLIFDTGAPINLLNNKIAKEAGLLKGAKAPPLALFGTKGDIKVKKLDVGGVEVEDVPAVVMDHPTVKALSDALGPIDGIIGFPFFARFKMTLNYKDKTMTLEPNGFSPPDVMQAMQTALMASLLGGKDVKPIVLSSEAQFGLSVAKDASDDEAGVTIKKVLPGSPADKAGLKEGDRLLVLDDRWTDSVTDTYAAASFVKPGSTVVLKVSRQGKEQELKVTTTPGY